MRTNVEEEGAYSHTLHTKGEKECNVHVNGGMIGQKLYHTLAYMVLVGWSRKSTCM